MQKIMTRRRLGQEMAERMGVWGFNRDHAIKVINIVIEEVKNAIKASPKRGEIRLWGVGRFRWHQYRGKWIRKVPRVYMSIKLGNEEKYRWWQVRHQYEHIPWFVGEDARKNNYFDKEG